MSTLDGQSRVGLVRHLVDDSEDRASHAEDGDCELESSRHRLQKKGDRQGRDVVGGGAWRTLSEVAEREE